jgi:hypothetical protein
MRLKKRSPLTAKSPRQPVASYWIVGRPPRLSKAIVGPQGSTESPPRVFSVENSCGCLPRPGGQYPALALLVTSQRPCDS